MAALLSVIVTASLGYGAYYNYNRNYTRQVAPDETPPRGETLTGDEAATAHGRLSAVSVNGKASATLPETCSCTIGDTPVSFEVRVVARADRMAAGGDIKPVLVLRVLVKRGDGPAHVLPIAEDTAPTEILESFLDDWSVACDEGSLYLATAQRVTRWDFPEGDGAPKAAWSRRLPTPRRGEQPKGEALQIECSPASLDEDELVIPLRTGPDIRLATHK